MRRRAGIFLLCFILMNINTAVSFSADEVVNNGMDITRPLTRLDVRYQVQELPAPASGTNNILTLRADRPFTLARKFKLSTRLDMPFVVSNASGPDNREGKVKAGLGDFLAQALLIYSPTQRLAFAGGAQLLFPTAGTDEMGCGKYTILPTFGARMDMHELSRGSFTAMVFRYNVDYAGSSNRNRISELQFAPLVLVNLPGYWFVNLFPSPEIRYNFADERPGDKGRWFIPLDVMVGRMLSKTTVASLEVSVPIIKDYAVYDFKVEARVGFFF